MLNNISWASYAYAVGLIIGIYYLFIVIVYYRKEIQNLFVSQKNTVKLFEGNSSNSSLNATAIDGVPPAVSESNSEKQELILSLQSLIKKAGVLKYPKEELQLALQLRLKHYPASKSGELRNSINIFIKEACQNNCSIHLSDEEVKELWGIELGGVS